MQSGQADVSFLVTLEVKPGREAEFLDLLLPLLDAMRHEATFVNAVLHRDPAVEGRFLLYETWRDLEELVAVQLERPYRRAYHERLPDLLRRPREVQTLTPLRSDFAFFAAA